MACRANKLALLFIGPLLNRLLHSSNTAWFSTKTSFFLGGRILLYVSCERNSHLIRFRNNKKTGMPFPRLCRQCSIYIPPKCHDNMHTKKISPLNQKEGKLLSLGIPENRNRYSRQPEAQHTKNEIIVMLNILVIYGQNMK
jgi:hypothetical protein